MQNKINYRELNVSVFNDTAERCRTNTRLRESIAQSRRAQKFTGESEGVAIESRNIHAERAKVIVSQKRTFEAAQAYAGTRVAVLNFASASHPGGGAGVLPCTAALPTKRCGNSSTSRIAATKPHCIPTTASTRRE